MLKTRYAEISSDLENRIASGEIQERLPGIIKLVSEYKTGQATVKKAISLLEKKGLVTINKTHGTFVSSGKSSRRKYGMIGIVGGINNKRKGWDSLLEDVAVYSRKYNHHITYIGIDPDMLKKQPELISSFPVDGLIFIQSTISRNIVLELRKKGIPFVSAIAFRDVPGVNWVDFGTMDTFAAITDRLVPEGRKRIGFAMLKNSEYGFQGEVLEGYKKSMEKHGCYESELFFRADSYLSFYKKHGEDCFKAFGQQAADYFLSLKSKPDTVFLMSYNDAAEEFQKKMEAVNLKMPQDISLIVMENNPGNWKSNSFSKIIVDFHVLLKESLGLFFELMNNPAMPPVNRYIPLEYVDVYQEKFNMENVK